MRIFFDVDGVLVDGWHEDPDLRKPWNENLEVDLGVSRSDFERLFFVEKSHPLGSVMDSCVAGQRDLKEALSDVLPKIGFQGHVEEFVQYWFQKDSNVSTEVLKLVKKLRRVVDVELFVATGQEHYRAAYLKNELGLSALFKEIFYSADIGYLKNDLRFFEAINERLGIARGERPVFFDDSEAVVMLARRAGWDAVAFRTAEDIRLQPRISALF